MNEEPTESFERFFHETGTKRIMLEGIERLRARLLRRGLDSEIARHSESYAILRVMNHHRAQNFRIGFSGHIIFWEKM